MHACLEGIAGALYIARDRIVYSSDALWDGFETARSDLRDLRVTSAGSLAFRDGKKSYLFQALLKPAASNAPLSPVLHHREITWTQRKVLEFMRFAVEDLEAVSRRFEGLVSAGGLVSNRGESPEPDPAD